ncbi:hypothetical protein D3Z36_07410 [Lachnospiraceae bacterium]|nr:hypothetical protein [Lachnospiraceae bacterium]
MAAKRLKNQSEMSCLKNLSKYESIGHIFTAKIDGILWSNIILSKRLLNNKKIQKFQWIRL